MMSNLNHCLFPSYMSNNFYFHSKSTSHIYDQGILVCHPRNFLVKIEFLLQDLPRGLGLRHPTTEEHRAMAFGGGGAKAQSGSPHTATHGAAATNLDTLPWLGGKTHCRKFGEHFKHRYIDH